MNELIIKGQKHPVFFDFLAIEKISQSVSDVSLDDTVKKVQSLAGTLKFARDVAFFGIEGGYRQIGEPCPFKSSEHLAESIKKYSEIQSSIGWYTESVAEFYNTEDGTGEAKGEATPLLSEK